MLFTPFVKFPAIFTYVSVKQEQNAYKIEQSVPDFLRQLSSIKMWVYVLKMSWKICLN